MEHHFQIANSGWIRTRRSQTGLQIISTVGLKSRAVSTRSRAWLH